MMKEFAALLCLPLLLAVPALTSVAQGNAAQGQARKESRAGNIRMSTEIEQRVIPQMPGWQYLGFDFDEVAMAYRLRFIRDGRVVFVDVDARSGAIIEQRR